MSSRAVPRIVFADMDGTFVATDKSVPVENMSLLDWLEGRGVPFVPCTGRPVSAVPAKVLAHPATRYAVGSNGSVIEDVKRGERLHVTTMEAGRVIALYERVRDLPATFDVFVNGEVLSERGRYDSMGSLDLDAPTLAMLRKVRKPCDLTVPQIVRRAGEVEKITCFWGSREVGEAIMAAAHEVGGLSAAQGHPKDVELQAQGVSKGSALRWLCGHLGIPTSAAVAFGDEDNDVSLLAAAGDGVAMANATPRTKEVADHLAPSNDEAGVARYLMGAELLGHLAPTEA